jgi:hypothetical protein
MDDIYAINVAKTRFREGFNAGDPEEILSLYDDAFADMSFAMPSFYYSDAKDVFRARLLRLFRDYTARMTVIVIDIGSVSTFQHRISLDAACRRAGPPA